MSDAEVAAILGLPVDEKLHLVELLWNSIAADSGSLPLEEAHRAELDKALAEHRLQPDDVLTLDQLFAEVRSSQ